MFLRVLSALPIARELMVPIGLPPNLLTSNAWTAAAH